MLAVLSAVILSFSAVSGCFLNVSASKLSLSAMAEETGFSGSEELIYVVGNQKAAAEIKITADGLNY